MNEDKDIKCDYCGKKPKEKVDEYPTWFGRYRRDQLIKIICSDCLKKHREEWGKIKK